MEELKIILRKEIFRLTNLIIVFIGIQVFLNIIKYIFF